jgi:thioredoxin reductase (NADPH)
MSDPPFLLVINSDLETLDRVTSELERRYEPDYEVARAASAQEAATISERLALDQRRVALILSSLKLSDGDGWEAMAFVRARHSGALRILLLEPGARDENLMVQRPLQMGLADHYALVPLVSPDEMFHAAITELLAEWARTYGPHLEIGQLVGKPLSPRTHELRDLLARNGLPIGYHDADSGEGRRILNEAGAHDAALPVLVLWSGLAMQNPSDAEVADAVSGGDKPDWTTFDVAVIGGGPAGLAAGVSGASEGLLSFVLDRAAMGGQAGTTSRIRNYLGFPRGISGQELARRAFDQAWTFGVAFQFARSATAITETHDCFHIELSDGVQVRARTIVLAPGADYRRLELPALEALVGTGVYYGAAVTEAAAMKDKQVFVVGGGNSAGQAALHLSRFARKVTMAVRGRSLSTSMSEYLITEMRVRDNITIHCGCRVVGGGGTRKLEFVELLHADGERASHEAEGLFILIGAEPRTEWLPEEVQRDEWGYVLTGPNALSSGEWPLERSPFSYETAIPGIFAVGDVRHGSVKRVASAVGEGSVVIQDVHRYLDTH